MPFNYTALHEWFYNVILSQINSVPIQSLWLAFFTSIPTVKPFGVGDYENGAFPEWIFHGNAAINLGLGIQGLLFAQAVKIPGDGINTSRVGPDNMGLIKGVISNGRKELETINISFLDTNFSFTDLNLRPWTIMVGHKGLKDSTLKTSINIVQLAKAGPGKFLQPRAHWIFHDAAPISIDTQQYDYGADKVIQRQIEFAYNYYTMQSIGIITPEQLGIGSLRGSPNAEIVEVPSTDHVTSVAQAGLDILNGGGEHIKTNVSAQTTKTINELRREGQQILKTTSVPEAAGKVINDIRNYNENRNVEVLPGAETFPKSDVTDTPYGGTQIAKDKIKENITSTDDRIRRIREPLQPITVRNASETRQNVEVPEDDTPSFVSTKQIEGGLTEQLAQKGKEEFGGIEGSAKQAVKDAVDTPLYFQNLKDSKRVSGRTIKASGEANIDTPSFNPHGGAFIHDEHIDTPKGIQIKSQNVPNKNNDTVNTSNISKQEVVTIKNDNVNKNNILSQKVSPMRDDIIKKSNIKTQEVNIKMVDTIKRSQIPVQIVTIKKNDIVNKDQISSQIVNIKNNDTSNKNEILNQSKLISDNDIVKKGLIPFQENIIPQDDVVTSSSIFSRMKKINPSDTVKGSMIPIRVVEIEEQDVVKH